jgi:hypothetical protein
MRFWNLNIWHILYYLILRTGKQVNNLGNEPLGLLNLRRRKCNTHLLEKIQKQSTAQKA